MGSRGLLPALLLLAPLAAPAGVLHQVSTEAEWTGDILPELDAIDEIFGATSADITTNVGVQINDVALGSHPVFASSSAGQFGSVGLETAVLGGVAPPGTVEVTSRVYVASDEFVNLSGLAQHATANFVIDGGLLEIVAGRDATAGYDLTISAYNLGAVPIETDRGDFSFLGVGFPDAQFSSHGVLQADANGDLSLTTLGADIGVVLDPNSNTAEIPLSFQSFDIGTLLPGDRLFLVYDLLLTVTMGSGELSHALFSDPLTLSGEPVLPTIRFEPTAAPEPPVHGLLAAGGIATLLLAGGTSRRRPRTRRPEADAGRIRSARAANRPPRQGVRM